MEYYSEAKINELVEELHAMCQDDADDIAREILTEISGDMSPYSDGDEIIAAHQDILTRAEELVARYNK